MNELREEIEIAVAPDKAWTLLSDFAAAHRYVPGIASSKMSGMTRICVMPDGQEIHEAISDVSPGGRSYRYEHVKTPMPVKQSGGCFSVSAHGSGCKVRIDAQLVAASPEMQPQLAEMMREGLRATLENLRMLLERGG